jgi:hypothetical protein
MNGKNANPSESFSQCNNSIEKLGNHVARFKRTSSQLSQLKGRA